MIGTAIVSGIHLVMSVTFAVMSSKAEPGAANFDLLGLAAVITAIGAVLVPLILKFAPHNKGEATPGPVVSIDDGVASRLRMRELIGELEEQNDSLHQTISGLKKRITELEMEGEGFV